MKVLVTGATGFIGGAVVPDLLAAGHEVTCLVREPARLVAPWRTGVRVVTGRVEDAQAVLRAGDGAEVALFLVHGMGRRRRGLVVRERQAAAAFRDGAELAGISHLVYLGGLVDEDELWRTAEHRYARHQAGVALRQGAVPVTELRAGIVLGAGSASFALLLAAAQGPVQIDAPWAARRTQPVAIADLRRLLVRVVAEGAGPRSSVLEVGGPEVVTYGELVARTRQALGAPARPRLRVPYLPPEVAAVVGARAAGLPLPLVGSLLPSVCHDAVVRDDRLGTRFPGVVTTGLAAALNAAVAAHRRAAG